MENKQPLLSICIPTYNRALVLKESLESLEEVMDDPAIQVIVVDNASTDNTSQIVEPYMNRILYFRNNENIGGDMNILRCYIISKDISKYVCVLGDSYRLCRDNLKTIMAKLREDVYHLVINGANRGHSVMPMDFHNCDDVLSNCGGGMDLTGTIIINTDAVDEKFYSKYLKTNFIHWGMCFEYIASIKDLHCTSITQYYIKFTQLHRSNTWYSKSIEIFVNGWVETINMLPSEKYTTKSKLKAMKDHDRLTGIFRWSQLTEMRFQNKYNSTIYEKYRDNLNKALASPTIGKIIAYSPLWILKVLLAIKQAKSFIVGSAR